MSNEEDFIEQHDEIHEQNAPNEANQQLLQLQYVLSDANRQSRDALPSAIVTYIIQDLEFSNLQSLVLNGSKSKFRLGDLDIGSLIQSVIDVNVQLVELDLSNNRVTDAGLREICRLINPRTFRNNECALRHLDVTGNDIVGACIEQTTLVTKFDCTLISLNLSFNALSDRGQAAVANVVKHNRNLKRLFINNCSFNLRGMNDLISKFHDNQSIEELGLDRPLIENAREGRILDHMSRILLKNSTLHTLSLKYHNLFDTEAQLLSESMNIVGNLVSLNLEGNKIGVIGAEAIASAMLIQQHRSLQHLGLSFNHVSDDGAIALAETIKDQKTSLRSLTLRNNDIGPIGLTALANALESPNSLERLVIFGNRFDNNNGIQYMDIITHRVPYTGLQIDISVYVVDGKYMIAEN